VNRFWDDRFWRRPALRQPDSERPFIGKPDIPERRLEGEFLTDAVEKVGYEAAAVFL